jgi:hypothetical protein
MRYTLVMKPRQDLNQAMQRTSIWRWTQMAKLKIAQSSYGRVAPVESRKNGSFDAVKKGQAKLRHQEIVQANSFNVCDNAHALISENRHSVSWCLRIAYRSDFLGKCD